MLSYQQVASLAIIIAIFGVGLVECQIYTENTVSFNSTTLFYASSFGINYPTNTSVSAPRTKFASVRFNVSDATFVDTSAFFQIVDTIVYKTNTSYTSATAGPITGSFGAIVPPCFPANRSESYFFSLEFNATTNAVYGEATYVFGEDDIPTITNGSSFEVGCRVPGLSKCNDYYSLSISATPISALYTLSVESPTNLTLYFYPKNNNTQCDGLPYTIIANKLEAIGLPVIDAPLDFWLGVQTDDGSSPEVKMWWTLLATDSPSGDNTPQAQTPDTNNNTPSNNIIDELPRWAVVLLIIFGIAVLVLTIVVIVMCVKRNKRAQYSTM